MSEDFFAAFVLYTKPYQETSALVETFCREHGRVGMVYRRVRGGKSSKTPLLQPFQPLWVSFTGQHELRSGRQIESRGASLWLTGGALISGLYLNELLVRLLHRDDPHPRLFDTYQATLQGLASAGAVEPWLRQFERCLLAELGYEINLDEDVAGNPLGVGCHYRFLPDSGFLPVAHVAQDTYDGEVLLAIRDACYDDPEARRAAKRLFRHALSVHLGHKPLASRALFSPSMSR